MKKLHLTLISATVASLLLIGCGGGGEGDDKKSGTSNKAPTAKIESKTNDRSITLDGSTSSDSDGKIVKYEWYDNGEYIGEGATLTKDDFTDGKHTITLKITDNAGATKTKQISINIGTDDKTEVTKPITRTKIVKTGQTKSYNYRGDIITDGSVKDDGYYQAGIDRNYTRSDVGIVKDNVTGLEWQDVPEGNGLYGYEEAKNYCANLNLDGTGWRLPEMYDFWYLENYSRAQDVNGANNILDSVFKNVTRAYYATSYFKYTFPFKISLSYGGMKVSRESNRVKCVRGAKTYTGNCSRNNNNDTIVCNDIGLIVQDVQENETAKLTWEESIKYCENLEFAGYTDWRLPNINELRAITKSDQILHKYTDQQDHDGGYWSSTSYVKFPEYAYFAPEGTMNMTHKVYGDVAMVKGDKARVRCVR